MSDHFTDSQAMPNVRVTPQPSVSGLVGRAKWLVVPYGNAVHDGKPESEWDWCVNRDDDSESIEVENKERAEQLAAFLNGDLASTLEAYERACRELPNVPTSLLTIDLAALDGRVGMARATPEDLSNLLGYVRTMQSFLGSYIEAARAIALSSSRSSETFEFASPAGDGVSGVDAVLHREAERAE